MADILQLNYAGLPMKKGDPYGGKPEFLPEGSPKVLSADPFKESPIVKGKKVQGWAARWLRIKADPLLYAQHMAKLKAGRARAMAVKRLKAMKKDPREQT